MMSVEVVTPDKFMGDVTGSLSAKRGIIEGMEQRGLNQAVKAVVPLSEMFGYMTTLRSMTEGRAGHSATLILAREPITWIRPTPSVTPTPSITPTNTPTPTPSITPTDTLTPTISPTPSITPTDTPTPTISPTPTERPHATPSATETPQH